MFQRVRLEAEFDVPVPDRDAHWGDNPSVESIMDIIMDFPNAVVAGHLVGSRDKGMWAEHRPFEG